MKLFTKIKAGLVILGFLMFSATSNPAFSQPSFQWAKQAGNFNTEFGNATVVDASGNVYVTGLFYGTVDFDPGSSVFNLVSAGSADIFILKLSPSGSFIWAIRLGGTAKDEGQDLVIDEAGNIHLAGQFLSIGADFDPGSGVYSMSCGSSIYPDVFVLKLNSSGSFIWARKIGGDISFEAVTSINVNSFGDVYTTGHFNDSTDFDPGTGVFKLGTEYGISDGFISKLSSSGNFIWAGKIGGKESDYIYSLAFDNSDNAFISGSFQDTSDLNPGTAVTNFISKGNEDIFLVKLDPSCNFLWAKQLGGAGTDETISIAVDKQNDICMTGYFQNTADFDPSSAVFNMTTSGMIDIFVAKFNSSGALTWAKRMGGTGNTDYGMHVRVDANGNLFVAGIFEGTADFDPGSGTYNLTMAGVFDIFLVELNSLGEFVCAAKIGGIYDDAPWGMTLDAGGNVILTGFFKATTDFDPSSSVFNMTAVNGDIFVCKLGSCSTTDIGIVESSLGVRIFPNPAHDNFTVELNDQLQGSCQIKLFDVQGRVVAEKTANENSFLVPTKELQPGIYFIEIATEKSLPVRRTIVIE